MAIASGITVRRLSAEETRQSGYTHQISIPYTAVSTDGGAGTSSTMELLDVAAGDVVTSCAFYMPTKYDDGDGGITSLTCVVGDGGSTNRFLTSTEMSENHASEVQYKAGTNTAPHAYTTADTVDAVFTATGDNLNTLTAGQLYVYLGVHSLVNLTNGTH